MWLNFFYDKPFKNLGIEFFEDVYFSGILRTYVCG